MTAVHRCRAHSATHPVGGVLTLKIFTAAADLIEAPLQSLARELNPSNAERLRVEALARWEDALQDILQKEVEGAREAHQRAQPRGVRVQAYTLCRQGPWIVSTVAFDMEDLKTLPLLRGAGSERPFRGLRFTKGMTWIGFEGPIFANVAAPEDGLAPETDGQDGARFELALSLRGTVIDHDAHRLDPDRSGRTRLAWTFSVPRRDPAHLRFRVAAEPAA